MAQAEADLVDAHAPFPGTAHKGPDQRIEDGIQVAGFREALRGTTHFAVRVAQGKREGPRTLTGFPQALQLPLEKPLESLFHLGLVTALIGKGFLFPEGFRCRRNGRDRLGVLPPGKIQEGTGTSPEDRMEQVRARADEIPDALQPDTFQPLRAGRSQPGQVPEAEGREEGRLVAGRNHREAMWLVHLAGDTGNPFPFRESTGNGDLQPLADFPVKGPQGPDRGLGSARTAPENNKPLVNRGLLKIRGHILTEVEEVSTELLVEVELAPEEDQFRTELKGPPARHGTVDPVGAGLVARRADNAPGAAPDRHRAPAQTLVGRLLNRGKKGVRIKMGNGRHGEWLNRKSFLCRLPE